MSQRTTEVVRVGTSGARIVCVSTKRIDYIDMTGQECFVDLEESARNWQQRHHASRREFLTLPGAPQPAVDIWNAHCVGLRGALDQPPWVQFTNDRKTRFEFGTCEALYRELLEPLELGGWHTFDTD
jgi:hypothetical protein